VTVAGAVAAAMQCQSHSLAGCGPRHGSSSLATYTDLKFKQEESSYRDLAAPQPPVSAPAIGTGPGPAAAAAAVPAE
jgi:hypothetical protein